MMMMMMIIIIITITTIMINFLLTTMEAQNYEEFLDKEKGVFIKQL